MISPGNYFLIASILMVIICQFGVFAPRNGRGSRRGGGNGHGNQITQEQVDQLLSNLSAVVGTNNRSAVGTLNTASNHIRNLHGQRDILSEIIANMSILNNQELVNQILENNQLDQNTIAQVRRIIQNAQNRANANNQNQQPPNDGGNQ